jgi:lipid-binding SYLF domain-containing protein
MYGEGVERQRIMSGAVKTPSSAMPLIHELDAYTRG